MSEPQSSREFIRKWFAEMATYLKEQNDQDKLDESIRFFNLDESSFFLCPQGEKLTFKVIASLFNLEVFLKVIRLKL